MRLFVGIDLPAHVKDDLARAARALEPSISGARWVPRDSYHVTLSFLGGVPGEQLEEVTETVRVAARAARPGEAAVIGLGAFPTPARARVVWAGIEDHAGVVAGSAEAVGTALAGIGFPREQRAFHAHVTLARMRVPARVALDATTVPRAVVPVRDVTLFRSHLGRPQARYEALVRVPLGAP